MCTWTQDILPRHGELVQHLVIWLAEKWLHLDDDDQQETPDVDNLWEMANPESDDFESHYSIGLSPQNFIKVLIMCPNVEALKIGYPDIAPHHVREVHLLSLHRSLAHSLSRLNQLRHLTLTRTTTLDLEKLTLTRTDSSYYGSPCSMSDRYVTTIICCLPLLESFSCSHLTRSELSSSPPFHKPFEWHLAQLRSLSKLELEDCDCLDRTWSSQSWSKNLTSLSLKWCAKLTTPDLRHILDTLAPHLTNLELLVPPSSMVSETGVPGSVPFSQQWAASHRFRLPALARLTLHNTTLWDLLSSFGDCKSLSHVKYIGVPADEWKVIQEMVCAMTWPKLEVLNFKHAQEVPPSSIPSAWSFWERVSKLRKFCLKSGIKFMSNV